MSNDFFQKYKIKSITSCSKSSSSGCPLQLIPELFIMTSHIFPDLFLTFLSSDHQIYHYHVRIPFPVPVLAGSRKPPAFTTFHLYWSSFSSLNMPSCFSPCSVISLDFYIAGSFLSLFTSCVNSSGRPALTPYVEFSGPCMPQFAL